jgi:hypothetical protein
MGIQARMQALVRAAHTAEQARALAAAYDRLVGGDSMGTIYKARARARARRTGHCGAD